MQFKRYITVDFEVPDDLDDDGMDELYEVFEEAMDEAQDAFEMSIRRNRKIIDYDMDVECK